MANTKLDKFEKQALKEYKAEAKDSNIQLMNLNEETVMAYKVWPNTVEFSLSVKSHEEQKFRVKVGEFNALFRFAGGETVKMARYDFVNMCEAVWDAYPL